MVNKYMRHIPATSTEHGRSGRTLRGLEILDSYTSKRDPIPSPFRGTEFKVEGLEFMHHHGPSFLDILLSKNDQETALKAGRAIPHRFAPQSGWVSFRIEKPEDLESAKKLIQLAYQNAKTSMEAYKMSRGQSRLS